MSLAFKEGTQEERAIALQRTNEAAAIVRATSPVGGGAFEVDPGKPGFFGGLKNIRLTRLAANSLSMPLRIEYENLLIPFEEADPSSDFGTLFQQLLQTERGRGFIGGLTSNEAAKFQQDAQAVLGSLTSVLEGAPEEEESEVEKARAAFQRGEIPGKELFRIMRKQGKPVSAERQRIRGR